MATSVADRAETRCTGRQVVAVSHLVLAAKITVPRVPGWAVPRPRINELMARDGRWSPLTVLTGPPGAGKTMALALWAAADHGAVAWVTLDDYDNQPTVFWSYVVAALHRAGVAVPGVLPAAVPEEAVGHLFLRRLVSALADQDPPVTLIIDDLHLLTESRVLDSLDYVLRNAGSGLRLVVTSRMDPLLPLHRYRLAGRLTEIRFGDLALSVPETGLLMAQHGIELSADSLECLTQRTEGWAAGIRLAAISMTTHPDPDQFVKELIAEDSAVTGYLVDEALNTQPPEVRDLLLRTSVLERVGGDIAAEMAGQEHAAGILRAVAHTNAFVQPVGHGWYRYHPLFAEVLRLKLRREYPEGIATLHYRAARWFARNGPLTDAVRHAAEAGDWKLAAGMVIDGLAIGEIIEPRGSRSLAGEFRGMPDSAASSELQPLLVSAAIAVSAGRYDLSTASLGVAQGILDGLPGHQEAASRLAAAMIRLAASRRTGDLTGAAAAAAAAEVLVDRVTDQKLARHPEIRTRVLSCRGAVELWSGRLGAAARVLDSGAAAATDSGAEYERADCLGYLALVEALRGGLGRAVKLAAQAEEALAADGPLGPVQHPNSAALVAFAWVHLERNELRAARRRLKDADAALGVRPDKLVGAIARLAAARAGVAEGRPGVATRMVAMARCGWLVPPWLEQRLSQVESQAYAAVGGNRAAFAAVPAAPLIVEHLSDREREVLRSVSEMLSVTEVATELYISVNTVKSHLKNIYRKLAATRRSEAVRRARQLELI